MYSNSNRSARIRVLIIALVMCLGLYPATELTRVIWVISFAYDSSRLATWIAETVMIWVLYLSIIPVMLYSSKWLQVDSDNGKMNNGITALDKNDK